MACGIQHGASALGAGLPATGTASHPSKTGAGRCGKQNPFPTSPHPRLRLRTKVKRGVTLTFHLVQKIGPVTDVLSADFQSVISSDLRKVVGNMVRIVDLCKKE